MCFEHLPIEFDVEGRARLRAGVRDPSACQVQPLGDQEDRLKDLLARNGFIKSVDYDPVTRVAGALAFHSVVDLENRTVHDAHSMATLFRGYEVILKGRDPRDAIYISSRACGVKGSLTRAARLTETASGKREASLPRACFNSRSSAFCPVRRRAFSAMKKASSSLSSTCAKCSVEAGNECGHG